MHQEELRIYLVHILQVRLSSCTLRFTLPIKGSPGFLQKGIIQLEVLYPTVSLPTVEELFHPLQTHYKKVLIRGIWDAPPWPPDILFFPIYILLDISDRVRPAPTAACALYPLQPQKIFTVHIVIILDNLLDAIEPIVITLAAGHLPAVYPVH